MPISEHLSQIRSLIGHRLLCLPSVTGILRNDHGDLLLVRNCGSDQWTTPGGMIEPNERPAESVVRELREELNIAVKATALLGVFSGPEYRIVYPNRDEVVYVMSVFECKLLSGTPEPDKQELEACRFVSKDDQAALQIPLWLRDLLEHLDRGDQFN